MSPRRARLVVLGLAAALGALLATLAFARYGTCHQRTFDLALYARLAWGLARGDGHEPILGGHLLGEHAAFVLWPLGWLGRLFGTVPVLLSVQALAYGAGAVPLARFASRRGGPVMAVAAAVAWLLYPNLGHVIAYEFHPGNLALPALALGIDAADRGDTRALAWATAAALVCRDDLGATTALLAVVAASRVPRAQRRGPLVVAAVSLAYVLLLVLVVEPRFAIAHGSLEAHFGAWGASLPAVAGYLLGHPGALVAHLARPERLVYLPKILAPVGLVLPLFAPRWLLPALPTVALNLVSHFVTTPNLDSHYLTPAVPFLVAAAVDGAALLTTRYGLRTRARVACLVVPAAAAHFVAGGTPLSRDFALDSFRDGADTRSCRAALAAVPQGASVQAPDPLLAHLVERRVLHRAPPPDEGAQMLVLDVTHRVRWAHDETLLRTREEPLVRDFLARPDRRVVAAPGNLLVLARGDPRGGIAARALAGRADPSTGTSLCACLSLLGASRDQDTLVLDFVARRPCPNDLALRLGEGARPRRVDLLADGLLSPVHLLPGDRVRSRHVLSGGEREALLAGRLRVGALRSSGAPPEPTDPIAVPVTMR